MSRSNLNDIHSLFKPLVGGKIKSIVVDPTPDNQVYVGFIIEMNKRTYEILAISSQDDESAGFMQITKISDYTKNSADSSVKS